MNDPGLQDPISLVQNELHQDDGSWDREEEQEETLLKPSRWWFASTASPLIAGTFGPIASSFNICALVQYWREELDTGGLEDPAGRLVKDPAWLLAVNAVSLACALVGNASLLLNMAGRVSFKIAQPITIAGFFLASFLLIALVSVASSTLFRIEPQSEHALTQAFYYACYAAGLYAFIGIMMLLTVYGALTGKYDKKFELTTSQRTLMLQTISFMAYMLVGAAIYSAIEGWSYNDAFYFADFTLLTIGIGDNFVPLTHAGKALVIPYTFGGILAVGLVIGSIRSMLLEQGAQKLHARTTEKKRQGVRSIEDAEHGQKLFAWLRPRSKQKEGKEKLSGGEKHIRRREFHAMRALQERAQRKIRYTSLTISVVNAAILWFIGALVFWYAEYKQDWSYFVSMYFAYTSLITLGYGDYQPLSNSGKSFFVFWSLLAIPTLTVLISDMGDTVVKGVSDATNWIGSLTIIPGDQTFTGRFKRQLNAATHGKLFTSASSAEDLKDDLFSRKQHADESRTGDFSHILTSRLSKADREAVTSFSSSFHPDSSEALDKDRQFYHFVLHHEIRAVFVDTKVQPPKKYTYDEWAYFLKLLGHDESNSKYHTRRYNRPKRDSDPAPQVGRVVDHDGQPRQWSWLGLRSPLMSGQEEAEWMVEKLIKKLGEELALGAKDNDADERKEPPLSVTDVRQGSEDTQESRQRARDATEHTTKFEKPPPNVQESA